MNFRADKPIYQVICTEVNTEVNFRAANENVVLIRTEDYFRAYSHFIFFFTTQAIYDNETVPIGSKHLSNSTPHVINAVLNLSVPVHRLKKTAMTKHV